MNGQTTFANREVCDLILEDYETGRIVAYIPYANTNTLEMSGESVYAYGGAGHPKRVTFNGDRNGTFAIETQLLTTDLYSIMTGALPTTAGEFMKRAEITASSAGALTIPAAWTNVSVYEADDDCGTALTSTVSGTTVTCTDVESGKTYIVYGILSSNSGVHTYSITNKTFPRDFKIYAETYDKTEDGSVVPKRMTIWKACPQTQFSMSNSNTGDPSTITITFDMMASKRDGDKIHTMSIYDAE